MTDARPARSRRHGLAIFIILPLFLPAALLLARGPAPQRARAVRAAPQRSPAWRRSRIQQDTHGHPPRFFRRLRDLPPAEQDRILQNDAQFHRLPPQQQRQILQNLRRWNSLTPQQRQVLRQRERIVQSLSPQQRQQLRSLLPHYRRLSPQQRRQVARAFTRVRNMRPQQRRRFFSSPQFKQRFTPDQRRVLRGWSKLLPQ
ncbi:MAG: DUF3106 domain-containing protein [Terriglobia bacterium]